MDIVTGEWEFFPAELIEENKNTVLCSPCGTGKTTALRTWLEAHSGKKVIALTFRRSLAYMLSDTYNFENYLNLKEGRKLSIEEHPRTVISLESLRRFWDNIDGSFCMKLPDVLILDEYVSILEHSFNDKTLDASRRLLFYSFLNAMLKDPNRTVIIADAYFQLGIDTDVFEDLAAADPEHSIEKYRVIVNERKTGEVKKVRVWSNREQWRDHLKATFHDSNDKKNIFLFTNYKKVLNGLQQEISGSQLNPIDTKSYPATASSNCLYLSSDSSPMLIEESSTDPDTVWSEYKLVGITPVIPAGISFMENHFHKAYGYASTGSNSPLAFLQQLHRVRKLADNEIELFVSRQDKSKMRTYPSKDSIVEFLQNRSSHILERYARCLETNCVHDVENGRISMLINNKSIVNIFCIRVCRAYFFAKTNYLKYFETLCEVDNFQLEILNKDECRDLLLEKRSAAYADWELATLEFEEGFRKSSFSNTILRAIDYKLSVLFGQWDGHFRRSTLASGDLCSSSMTRFMEFLEKWGALGVWGTPSELLDIEKPFIGKSGGILYRANSMGVFIPRRIEKSIKLSRNNCGIFYASFVDDNDKQETFYRYICNEYFMMVENDYREKLIGNPLLAKNAQKFSFISKLFDIMGIAKRTEFERKNWLGATVRIMKYIDVSTQFQAEDISALTNAHYYQRAPETTVFVAEPFKRVDEAAMNSPHTAERLWKLFREHWTLVYTDFIAQRKTCYKCNELPTFLEKTPAACTIKELTDLFSMVKSAIGSALCFLGLKASELKQEVRAALYDRPQQRYRFSCYEILGYEHRLLLCYCRLFKEYKGDKKAILHKPRADPFQLLRSDPKEVALYYRYRLKREIWAAPPEEEEEGAPPPPVDMYTDFRKKFCAFMNPVVINAMRVRGLIAEDKDAYDALTVSLSNIRYFWSLLRLGTASAYPLTTELATRKFIDFAPAPLLPQKLVPYRKCLTNGERRDVVSYTDTMWREDPCFKNSGKSVWEFYDLEDKDFYSSFGDEE